jgi:hypothetical protein
VAVIPDAVWKRLSALEALLNVAPEPEAADEPRASVVFYELGHLSPEHTEGLRRSQAPGASMDGDRVVYLIPKNGR